MLGYVMSRALVSSGPQSFTRVSSLVTRERSMQPSGRYAWMCLLLSVFGACSSEKEPVGTRGPGAIRAGSKATGMAGTTATDPLGDTGGAASPNIATTAPGAAGTPGLRPDQCAAKDITTQRIVPTIWLVV